MLIQIITNNQTRNIKAFYDLTTKQQKQAKEQGFSNIEDHNFITYLGNVYTFAEIVNTDHEYMGCKELAGLGWQGVDTANWLVLKFVDDETVICGRIKP